MGLRFFFLFFSHFAAIVDHFANKGCISISDCGVWGERVGVQVSRKEFHTHIHLDYARVEFYLVKKKKKDWMLQ